ncbi:MFS transporter [Nocardia aurea]|uniref:MFS transporter n=1 Tax=Nocardia aurea TaxID=2144174 RepID=UPI0013001EA5|nr:MFS transporter [Nocardia aurea]
MRLEKYRRVLRTPGFPVVMLLSVMVKAPTVAIPIVLTMHVAIGLDRGYGTAGLAAAAWTVGVTLGAPFQGRFMDRRGLRAMLVLAIVVQVAFWVLAPLMPFSVFMVGALVSGLGMIPGSTVIRLVIAGLIPEDHRHTAYAMDSMVTEVSYMLGPALAVLAATKMSTGVALVWLGVALAISGAALALRNPKSGEKAKTDTAARSGFGWLNARLIAVFAATLAAGAVVAGYEVAIIATLRVEDQVEWTGVVLMACGVYSLAGGLAFGALPRSPSVPLVILLLGLATMPLGLVGDWRVLVLALGPATTLCAPAFASTATAASGLATDGTRARVMSVYTAALCAGSALGAPLAGAAFDAGGPAAGFAAVGGLGVAIAILSGTVLRRRPESTDHRSEPSVRTAAMEGER